MLDPFVAGQPYERFMGRWSRLVAPIFLDWLAAPAALRWLEIGCGTGALSAAILDHTTPAALIAVDPAEAFIALARDQLTNPRITFRVGDALHLPDDARAMDMAVCGLVLNFIPEPVLALQAMRRALRPGGTVALYVWDYGGKMEMVRYFWDSVVALDPEARALDQGVRFSFCRPEALKGLFAEAGMHNAEIKGLDVGMTFANFDDYWSPFTGGQGSAPGYLAGLAETDRATLKEHVRAALPFREDGSLSLAARAWAVRANG